MKTMYRKLISFLCVFIGCSFVGSLSAHAVVNGKIEPTLAKYAVMVLDNRGRMCTGVVIEQRSILTAAHCVTEGSDWRIFWRTADNEPIFVKPESIKVHPGFVRNRPGIRNRSIDLAIVTLEFPLPSQFEPMTLSEITTIEPGQKVTVAGYGLSDEKNHKSLGVMRRADLVVIEPFGQSTILLWLSGDSSDGSGGCQGDSGGPLIFKGSLVAITYETSGLGKNNCGVLTQGTLINPQRNWISSILKAQ
jgi:hypothetical protein